MRILDVSPRGAYPPRRGAAVRTYSLLRCLSARHEVRQFSFPQDGDAFHLRARLEQTQVTPTYSELRFRHPLASAANRLTDRTWVSAPVFSGLVLGLTRPPSLTSLLRWADVLLVEFPWQFEYCRRRSDVPCVLASHNVEALKFASWAEAARASVTTRPWVRYLERVEARAARGARLVLAVTAAEREHYIGRYGVDPERVVEIPNGADTEHYSPNHREARTAARHRLGLPERPTVIYLGSPTPPNRRGADWVRRLAVGNERFTFLAVGKGAYVDDPPPNLIVTGAVDDIRPYLDAADMALSPIEHGAGTNIKLLECMAAGLPTVVFARALRGLLIRDGIEVLVAEPSVRSLRLAIERIAGDPMLASRIGRAARALMVERYDWGLIARRLEEALTEMVDGTRGSDAANAIPGRRIRPGGWAGRPA